MQPTQCEGPPHADPSAEMWVPQLTVHPRHSWHPTKAPAVGRSPMRIHTHLRRGAPTPCPRCGSPRRCKLLPCSKGGVGSGPGRAGDATAWWPAMSNQGHCSSSCSEASLPPPFTNVFVSFILVFRLNPLYLFVTPWLIFNMADGQLPP